ncbi:aminoacyl-tRNA hydrolase [Plebeiibacterium sediminum]|uniref:Peptidyl-tRNA hydrolase n=1 Tax=Plebeiibacterium sediminum TaxID=2992112 RepID=A0AAE3M7L0_9BACT|nr:aminoacyl-tRNA hydrolase [Plebeiobacterium sediminum]MCW3788466.1 aminoacyl-tRNA hydrolase [Plebeiobacterium sediminum]
MIFRFLFKNKKEKIPGEMKYLVVGLGNIGSEYVDTRHNIGFNVLDELAKQEDLKFENLRYGAVANYKFKGKNLILLKPSTYMNLSGKAIRYWMQQEKILPENLLVIVDDLALPFGSIRMRQKGSDAGHNGLKNIQELFGHNNYSRIRFGIGDNYSRGKQIDYVLGKWSDGEFAELPLLIDHAIKMVKGFVTIGASRTMNEYNKK